MSNNSAGDRPRKKGSHRGDQPRQSRQRGERQPRGGRLSREEIEWARDLWRHREPADEIAQQLGAPLADIQALIAGWEGQQQ